MGQDLQGHARHACVAHERKIQAKVPLTNTQLHSALCWGLCWALPYPRWRGNRDATPTLQGSARITEISHRKRFAEYSANSNLQTSWLYRFKRVRVTFRHSSQRQWASKFYYAPEQPSSISGSPKTKPNKQKEQTKQSEASVNSKQVNTFWEFKVFPGNKES